MPGYKPSEAVKEYKELLQRAVSCISSDSILAVSGVPSGYRPSEIPHSLFLRTGPMRLRAKDGEDLRFDVAQKYAIVPRDEGGYRVRTLQYSYVVEDYETRKEILSYHWHPDPKEPVKYPHLHVKDGAGIIREELQRAHYPTNRVALEDVIQFLIESLHVPVREERLDDWAKLLEIGREIFRAGSTWGLGAKFEAIG